jgi:ATP-dependent RNA helicase RhlE
VLVATDIASRGIDVEALGHVVNFDVPLVPEDYIHRVGRTARAELTGEAFTFVAPDEEGDLRSIERAVGKALPRVTLPDFDYAARPTTRFEVPVAERLAKLRSQRSEERARARAKEERRQRSAQPAGGQPSGQPSGQPGGGRSGGAGGGRSGGGRSGGGRSGGGRSPGGRSGGGR